MNSYMALSGLATCSRLFDDKIKSYLLLGILDKSVTSAIICFPITLPSHSYSFFELSPQTVVTL